MTSWRRCGRTKAGSCSASPQTPQAIAQLASRAAAINTPHASIAGVSLLIQEHVEISLNTTHVSEIRVVQSARDRVINIRLSIHEFPLLQILHFLEKSLIHALLIDHLLLYLLKHIQNVVIRD